MADFADTNDDGLFDDAPTTAAKEYEEPGTTTEVEKEVEDPKPKLETKDEGVSEGEVEEEPPASNKEEVKEEVTKSGKMIPEHQFKAALKNVTAERDALQAKLNEKDKAPAPDRNKQPTEYDLELRVEASKQSMMRSVTDYDATIEHFRQMEAANPILTKIVSEDVAPARMAYDLAKKDLEVKEVMAARENGDWDAFKAWQDSGKPAKVASDADPAKKQTKVPNLNRTATGVDPNRKSKASNDEDDGLWEGHFNNPSRF